MSAPSPTSRRRGLPLAALAALALSAAGMAIVARDGGRAEGEVRERIAAYRVAQAGMGDALARLSAGMDSEAGSTEAPVPFGDGAYFVHSAPSEDGARTLEATGRVGASRFTLRLDARAVPEGLEVLGWSATSTPGGPIVPVPEPRSARPGPEPAGPRLIERDTRGELRSHDGLEELLRAGGLDRALAPGGEAAR
jgi:hypothetical protein